ncbi:heme exporter protein CcmB [Aquabacterium sp. OR-4]|uniref:heme exporter protein CcmB n=1 Tax=Aquabacterium sp. OR-4 TaxID=2978127 RepID=UPI0028C5E774|nr:heme exporter protein CcmB [Aquabacterium sp. OR-4]MDT7838713.1 heme exporter protein CcmB [Aquabacterium sp. OR-4]
MGLTPPSAALPLAGLQAAADRHWTPALRAIVGREWQLAWQRPADLALQAVFFVVVTSLFPLALRPEAATLQLLAPGVLWVAAFLAVLLASARLFDDDLRSGWLDQWRLAGVPLALLMAARMAVQWVLAAVPVLLVAPLVALQFALAPQALGTLLLALALGTGVLALLAAAAAALCAGARGQAALAVLLVLPLATPALVFGTLAVAQAQRGLPAAAELSLLGALLALAAVLAPCTAAAAVAAAIEE